MRIPVSGVESLKDQILELEMTFKQRLLCFTRTIVTPATYVIFDTYY